LPRRLSITSLQLILASHACRFSRAIWPVWSHYQEVIPEIERLKFDLKTEANILHRLIVANVKHEFQGVPGIAMVERNGFFVGIDGLPHGISGQAACRLKKLDERGHSCNYPTDRAVAIRNNDLRELDLEFSEATVVDVGYVLNPLRTGFADVQAVRVFDEAFLMNFPCEEGRLATMPRPLHGAASEIGRRTRFEISAREEENPGPTDRNTR